VLEIAENERGQPEWRPPQRGRRTWTPLARALVAAGNPWTLMIVLALGPRRMRLAHLYRRLPGVSMSLLDRYLQQMVELGLVERTRFGEAHPPRVEVVLTDAGHELLPIAAALARWGMCNAWSPPVQRERVDIAALLRLLPALLELTELPAGSLEAVVVDAEPPFQRLYEVVDGRLREDEQPPDELQNANTVQQAGTPPASSRASTSIQGDSDAWAAAFGSACDYERLSITGDEQLATSILEALPRRR
jgi:DNA-binding HxlR family transcriptional regulator